MFSDTVIGPLISPQSLLAISLDKVNMRQTGGMAIRLGRPHRTVQYFEDRYTKFKDFIGIDITAIFCSCVSGIPIIHCCKCRYLKNLMEQVFSNSNAILLALKALHLK